MLWEERDARKQAEDEKDALRNAIAELEKSFIQDSAGKSNEAEIRMFWEERDKRLKAENENRELRSVIADLEKSVATSQDVVSQSQQKYQSDSSSSSRSKATWGRVQDKNARPEEEVLAEDAKTDELTASMLDEDKRYSAQIKETEKWTEKIM